MTASAEAWYMPYAGRPPVNGGIDMAKTQNTDKKKAWLNRLRAGRRESVALEALSGTGREIAEHRRRELQAVSDEILKAIQTVPNMDQRSVLILRYVKCLEWHEVASTLHFSERHIMRLHQEALRQIMLPHQRQRGQKITNQ